jgi:hypothetical protein
MPVSWDKDGYIKFALDFEIDRFAADNIGILEGCAVSANGTDTNVNWTAGCVRHGNSETVVGAGSLNLSGYQHTVYPRKVLMFVDATDNIVKAVVGTTEATVPVNKIGRYTRKPLPPDFGGSYTLATGDVVLAEVWLRILTQVIQATDVTDRRVFIGLQKDDGDYEFVKVGTLYQGRRLSDRTIVASNSSATTAYDALIADLNTQKAGIGTVIDRGTGHTHVPGIYARNTYRDGIIYDDELKVAPIQVEPDLVISNFDGGATVEWTSNWTIWDDTVYPCHAGVQNIKAKAPVSSSVWINKHFAVPVNLKNGSFLVRFSIDETERSSYNGIKLAFTSDNWAHWAELWCPGLASLYGWSSGLTEVQTHNCNDATSGVDWTAINDIRIWSYANAGGDCNYYFDTFQFFRNRLRRGTIVWTTDEAPYAWEYQRPYLDQYGWRGCIAWGSNNLTGAPDPNYMAGLKKLARYSGWDVGPHSYEHVPADLLTEAEYARRYIRDMRAIRYYGLSEGASNIGIWANGATSYEHMRWAKQYFNIGRATMNYRIGFPNGAPLALPCYQDPTLVTAKNWVDNAESEGTLFVILIHNVRPTGAWWTPADMKEFADYLATKNVDVMTMSDLVTKYMLNSKSKTVESDEGTATVASGNATVTVKHQCRAVPKMVYVEGSDTETKSWWITDKTAAQFVINLPATTTADRTVKWRAWL